MEEFIFCKKVQNQSQEIKRIYVLFSLLVLLFSFSYAAWLENIPSQIIQPDSTIVEVFLSGDEFHNWAHDEDGYTIIQDPLTGYWCWAVAEKGDLVSTGFPIHTINRNVADVNPGENISNEKYREIRQPHDDELLLNNSRSPKTGQVYNIVIFVRFSGEDNFTDPFEDYEEMFNAPENEDQISLYQYFYEVSYGQLEITSHFFPIQSGNSIISYQSPYPRSHFTSDTILRSDLLVPAIEYIESQVPLNILPRSHVDNVCVIVSGNTDNNPNPVIWPHMFTLGNVTIQGKLVRTYNFHVENSLSSKKTGVLAHEFAHSMNFPDLYRAGALNPFLPVERWDLMADSDYPPRSVSSYLKMKYGEWITIPTISSSGTYTLHPLTTNQSDNAFRINSPNALNEYFILEYRNNDTGIIDRTIPGSGILIYRVNEAGGWGNTIPPDELYVYRPYGTLVHNGIITQAHFSFDEGRTGFNRSTEPEPFLSNGSPGGINITNIGSAGNTISFTYSIVEEYDYDLVIEGIEGPSIVPINQECFFTVSIKNDGLQRVYVSDYDVLLKHEETILSSISGVYLIPGDSYRFSLPLTLSDYGFYEIYPFIYFPEDEIQKNNSSQKIRITAQGDYITITPTDSIKEAIDLCLPGGVIELEGGEYNSTGTFNITDKDISLIGSENPLDITKLNCKLIFNNVSNAAIVKNIWFEAHRDIEPIGDPVTPIILTLINSTPILENIVVNMEKPFDVIGVSANLSEETNDSFEILDSKFYGGQGIIFNSNSGIISNLSINNCVFENKLLNTPTLNGTALIFEGNALEIINTKFHIDGSELSNINSFFNTLNILMNNGVGANNITINNNKFITYKEENPFNITDISIIGDDNYNFNLERNIFMTTGSSNNQSTFSRIKLSSSLNPTSYKSYIVNNTDILIDPYWQYNFISYSGRGIFHNNLLTGHIDLLDTTSENEISYNWFMDPQDFSNYPNVSYHNNHTGDPLLNLEEPYQPLWNSINKSLLIQAGHPELYDEIWYDDDPTNNDPSNIRRAIGAVPSISNSFHKYELSNPQDSHSMNPNNIAWVSFPYLDKLFQGFVDNTYSADGLYYNLHIYNDNNLFTTENERILDSFKWKYNGDFEIYYDQILGSWNIDVTTPALDSRYGYKIQMLLEEQTNLIVSGLLAELYGNDDEGFGTLPMTIEPSLHEGGRYTEIWVGYYKLRSEEPEIALRDIIDDLIEIKTQRWSMNRNNPNDEWIIAGTKSPRFNFGEAVSLKYVGIDPVVFTWNVENNSSYPEQNIYRHPIPQYFVYEEQLDYTPIYVYLTNDIISINGEMAIQVNNIIVGAEVINGDILQINAYLEGVDLEDADIEFLVYEYDTRSEEYKIDEQYFVFNQEKRVFQSKNLALYNKDMFHVISFREENENSIGDIPLITLLEGNYPNPFNPSTTIRYSLSKKENVNLKIYNIKGQLVKNLVNESQEPGKYSVIWDGDNEHKTQVSSGIYLYRFETKETTQIKKMLLIK